MGRLWLLIIFIYVPEDFPHGKNDAAPTIDLQPRRGETSVARGANPGKEISSPKWVLAP